MSDRYDYKVSIGGVDATAVFNKMGGPVVAKRYLANELILTEAPKPESPPEPVLDFLVRVDRSVRPSYPNWVKKIINPELELSGPAEYNLLTQVRQWCCKKQKKGFMKGHALFKYLQTMGILASCFNLQDGLAIQNKGFELRKLFGGRNEKWLILWGSVVLDEFNHLLVPIVVLRRNEVTLSWYWLNENYDSDTIALRFKQL